ncbi:MAG: ABC transporter permease [Lachnospiraceae bacterium]|nr:ABC transporter permease [Lachnospiraceae bacterium]
MLRYILKRLIEIIPVMLGIAFIIYAIMSFTPGDPARLILGANATNEAVENLREEMGLNDPFLVQFFNYIRRIVFEGDFGNSYKSGQPVFKEIFKRFPVSLNLAICGMIGSCLFGIPLGILSAVKQNTTTDNIISVIAMAVVAMPSFWVALVLVLVLSLQLKLLPSSGATSLKHYIMPMITIALANGCSVLRITRSSMLDVIRMDYLKTAKAKGVPNNVVIWKHAFGNALLPVITTVGTIFGSLLGGAIICETVFTMPGIGALIVSSIKSKDMPMVLASLIFLSAVYSLVMLAVDLLYAFVDPRIKAKYSGK